MGKKPSIRHLKARVHSHPSHLKKMRKKVSFFGQQRLIRMYIWNYFYVDEKGLDLELHAKEII